MPRQIRSILLFVLLTLALYPLGVICHEIIGHGLVGVLAGGKMIRAEILGLEIWPRPRWIGWQGHYGNCDLDGIPTRTGEQCMALAGALSTWCVALIAVTLLCVRRWSRPTRWILICLSLWWIDLFTYTLPTWGLRRSILWGAVYSEPYDAAVGLGMPGTAFQTFVAVTSVILVLALRRGLRRQRGSADSPARQ